MIKIIDASIITAFSFGVLSFLSPCVLPMVPLYVSYMVGEASKDLSNTEAKLRVIQKSIGFILGFTLVFSVLQLSIGSLSSFFIQNKYLVSKIGGMLIILFGIHISGIYSFKLFFKEIKFFKLSGNHSSVNSFFMGIVFSAGWTPCVDPLLATIIIYASSTQTLLKGLILMLFYCLGLGLPFLITALAIDKAAKWLQKITKYLKYISLLSGLIMIAMGILLLTNAIDYLRSFISNYLPTF